MLSKCYNIRGINHLWNAARLIAVTGTGRAWNAMEAGGAFGVGLLQGEEQPAQGKPNHSIFSAGNSGSILLGVEGIKQLLAGIITHWDCA